MTRNSEFFETFAPYYGDYYLETEPEAMVAEWTAAFEQAGVVPSLEGRRQNPPKLLDLGCGYGWHFEHWRRAGFEVSGLDASPSMLRIAANLDQGDPATRLYCADVLETGSLTCLAGQFHIIVAHFNFLNLFDARQLPVLFSSIRSLLGDTGCFATDVTMETNEVDSAQNSYDEFDEKCKLTGMERTSPEGNLRKNWRIDGIDCSETYWLHSMESLRAQACMAALNLVEHSKVDDSGGSSSHPLLIFEAK